MDDYEELQRKLAEMVVFLRGDTRCWQHPHFSFALLTSEGHVDWHGPICEMPLTEQQTFVDSGLIEHTWPCDWQDDKKRLVDEAIQILGGADMSRFL